MNAVIDSPQGLNLSVWPIDRALFNVTIGILADGYYFRHFSFTAVYMKPLSMDLKERILAAILNELVTMPAIAVRFSVNQKTKNALGYRIVTKK